MKCLLPILLVISFAQASANIPDSLNIDLPWQLINISSCDATMGEGPRTENEGVAIALELDEVLEEENGACTLRKKQWIIIDWVNSTTYDYIQLGKAREDINFQCANELFIQYDQFPVVLTEDDLILDKDPTHTYSFSFKDENVKNILIDEGTEDNIEVFTYDWTENTVCKTSIYVTKCEDDVVLVFPETTEIEFNQEPYILLTLELLGVQIDYPCGGYEYKISFGNSGSNYLPSRAVGSYVDVRVEVDFENGTNYKKHINVHVTGEKPHPVNMYMEELTFEAGETIELQVWSENIDGLVAWQLQLEFFDAEILDIAPSEMFDDIPFNIINNKSTLKALWTPQNALSIDALSNVTWFTITLKPEISGSTLDIFKMEQNPWSLIGIEDENYIYEYEADFVFNIAPKNLLNVETPFYENTLYLYPNPASHVLNLKFMNNYLQEGSIQVLNTDGQVLATKQMNNDFSQNTSMDISNLQTGVYILKYDNKYHSFSKKFIKI
ncbi:MAG: T9SS type A sorting domain-containing protein [Saprospiraceae bacterium]|nr:T9SS type A sorting domain-containing protein [Saprospiraceae bacterium]